MKDTHNVILILAPSKWLIPYFGGSSNSRFKLSIFLFRSSKLFQLSFQRSIKSLQGFTLCFRPLFPFVWSFIFVTGVLHEASSWWVHQGFNSFSKCSSRFFSKKLRLSSYCNPECNSFYRIIRGGIISFLIIWVLVFMIHK